MPATAPSLLLESIFRLRDQDSTVVLRDLFLSFLWVGIVEEFFKYLAVRLTVYRSKEFNEVMDGMIYMVSAALGFAATENVGYMLGFGYAVAFPRAILSYLAHISFSAILGFYMGKAKIEGKKNLDLRRFYLCCTASLSLQFIPRFGDSPDIGRVSSLRSYSFGLWIDSHPRSCQEGTGNLSLPGSPYPP